MKIGDKAPAFELKNQDGKIVRLADHIGQEILILAFYPSDFSPVCTNEMMCFKNDFAEFTQLGCKIIGISSDSEESHDKFKSKFSFPFELLSDPGAKVSQLYGCKLPLVNKTNRATFIIDKQGKIAYAHKELLPIFKRPNEELLEIIKNLK